MRIPSFLIKLHQRVKKTRAWKHKWKIIAFAPFITLLVIYSGYSIYNHLAERNFRNFVKTWESKGESTDPDQIFPSPPHKDSDFFQHPAILAEINHNYPLELGHPKKTKCLGFNHDFASYSITGTGDYHMGVATDISRWLASSPKMSEKETAQACLRLLEPYKKRLSAIAEATQRPNSYTPLTIDRNGNNNDTWILLLKTQQNISKMLSLRATLRIMTDDSDGAIEDITSMIHLYQHASPHKNLLNFIISQALITTYEKTLWHGLKFQIWDEPHLARLGQQLALIEPQKQFIHCMRGEFIFTTMMVQLLLDDPSCLENQKQSLTAALSLSGSSTWKEKLEDIVSQAIPSGVMINEATWMLKSYESILLYPNGKKCEKLTFKQLKASQNLHTPVLMANWGMGMGEQLDWLPRQIERALQNQASIHNMRTAIALERYRLKHAQYPENLNKLVPDYLPEVLEDVITGKPLHYRIKPDDTPLIYSIGSNEKDDGGHPHRHSEQGDWAWMYSPPTGFTFKDYKKR